MSPVMRPYPGDPDVMRFRGHLEDGRLVDVEELLFNQARLCVGPADLPWYDATWLYDNLGTALAAASVWDGAGTPLAWVKDYQTGVSRSAAEARPGSADQDLATSLRDRDLWVSSLEHLQERLEVAGLASVDAFMPTSSALYGLPIFVDPDLAPYTFEWRPRAHGAVVFPTPDEGLYDMITRGELVRRLLLGPLEFEARS